jgi:glyoxalase/bleomycin resistance protein/dioxygenase superfamily protein
MPEQKGLGIDMIKGIHGLFYTSRPEEARAFVRDKLQLPHTDVGDGWLIFDLPEGDFGFHPTDESGRPLSGTHDISFYCNDIESTVASLKKRGVVFDQGISDAGFGRITYFTIPGDLKVMLYEPKYSKSKPKRGAKRSTSSKVQKRRRRS